MTNFIKMVGFALFLSTCVSAGSISTIAGVTSGPAVADLNRVSVIVSNSKSELILNVWGSGYGRKGLRLLDTSLSYTKMINSSAPRAWSMTIASNGDLYLGHQGQIVKYDTTGSSTVVAGLGSNSKGFSGDGGLAVEAKLETPSGIVLDKSGNIFFADTDNQRIRKIDKNGYISTVAGNGTNTNSGDNGFAVDAAIDYPRALVIDSLGNLLVATYSCIRSIDPTGVIKTVVGQCGFVSNKGDGGLASAAYIKTVVMMRNTSRGLMFGYSEIRVVNAQGIISTLTSSGTDTTTTTGIEVQNHKFKGIQDITELPNGDIFIVDGFTDEEVWLLKPDNMLYLWAKGAPYSYYGDGGLAVNAGIAFPKDITVDQNGNAYFTDKYEKGMRKINNSGVMSLLLDSINRLAGIANDDSGNVYVVSKIDRVIYKFYPSGKYTIVAGIYSVSGDYNVGKNATIAALSNPEGVVIANGLVYIADTESNKIKYIDSNGIMRLLVQLSGQPTDIEYYKPDKAFYVLLRDSHEVVKIDNSLNVTVVAGTGVAGFSGDAGLAKLAQLNTPSGITLDADGYLYISDTGNNRIRMVSPSGIITTIAGTGNAGFSGDGEDAQMAELDSPLGLKYYNDGLLVCVKGRIRRVEGPFYQEAPVAIKSAESLQRSIKDIPKVDLLGRKYR